MNKFPGNKKFAFAVYDYTDLSTVENVGPVSRYGWGSFESAVSKQHFSHSSDSQLSEASHVRAY
jgi:hypothetical protein